MTYVKDPSRPVIIYEAYLPQRKRYRGKLREVLDAFLSERGIRNIPAVKLALRNQSPRVQLATIRGIQEVITGHSIYQVQGRFLNKAGKPEDETSWVIRFMIFSRSVKGGIKGGLPTLARDVIEYLVTKRFATELGSEKEVWLTEYKHCRLSRWIRR